jgi:NSS family neurotransmitter:Na+ symporter
MDSPNSKPREAWGSKLAFIFAATGSAIGLGNIWRFPMMVGKNGGAVFVFVYILAVVFIGFTVMLGELILGRHTQRNPVGAFNSLKPRTAWKYVGYLGVITNLCILSYYTVVTGWIAGYLVKAISGTFKGVVESRMTDALFSEFSADPALVFLFLIIVIGITTSIIARGVRKGIEKWTKILMPVLFVLLVLLVMRAVTLPGAEKGLAFYLKPDFSKFNGTIVLFALGQALFSLTLGMGTMVTYGSYLSQSENLVASTGWVCFTDTIVAILAGMIIFPTLYAIPGIAPTEGHGLVFKVFPLVFSRIPGGYVFGILLFGLLLVAALTSVISSLEVSVAYLIDERRWTRKKAAVATGSICFVLAVPSVFSKGGMNILTRIDFMGLLDFIFGNISLAVGALLLCVFLGYVWGAKKAAREVIAGNPLFRLRPLWIFSIKFLAPVAIILILVFIKTIWSG